MTTPPQGAVYIVTINERLFNRVKSFVSLFESGFDALVKRSDKPGTCFYWEENVHDKVVDILALLMPEYKSADISNALSAMGY